MHLTLLILSLVLLFRQSCYGEGQSQPTDTDGALSESVVPEEGPPVPQASAAMGESPVEAQSPVEEYFKEHPDASSVPASINSKPVKTKLVYNKYGDVISIPVTQKPKSPPMMPYMGGYNPYQYPMPIMQSMSMAGYPYPYGMPPPQMLPQPSPQMSFSPNKLASKSEPAIPEDVKSDFKQSETEDEKFAAIIQAAEQDKANKEYGKKGTYETATELSLGMGSDFMLRPPDKGSLAQMMPNPFMPPYQPYMQPSYQYMQPNQFKIDKNNIQMYQMSASSNGGNAYDPNLLRKLQTGRAKLDMANAKVVSVSTEVPESQRTESASMDEYPEIPEVVVKEQKKKALKKKTPATLIRNDEDVEVKEEYSEMKTESRKNDKSLETEVVTVKPKKPAFILRAKLNNLPKKGQQGKNAWWTKPVPDYCSDAIMEVTDCKHKKLQKRWSYNPGDERCYLYEDYCAAVKRNTFKSIQDCMKTCWRPK